MGQCKVCGRYDNRPCTVDGFVLNDKNEILLIKRKNDPYKGLYALPGGFVDFNETAKESVVRELKEETNLSVQVIDFLNYYDEIQRDEKRRTIALVFICKIKKNSKKLQFGDDAIDAKFFPLNKIPKKLAFDHKKIIDKGIAFFLNKKK